MAERNFANRTLYHGDKNTLRGLRVNEQQYRQSDCH